MYSMLLLLFTILSDLLTAASGVFGLLTEFKDRHKKITPSGKVALSGIILGLALSGVITVLEARNAEEEKREHEVEVARLGRPLDDHMGALLVLSIPNDAQGAASYRPS